MGNLLLCVFASMAAALLLGLKRGLGGGGMILLQLVATTGTIAGRSTYIHSLILDKVSPSQTRAKALQRRMEAAYVTNQPGAHLNLIVDYPKATQDMYTLSALGLRRMGDQEHLRRAELITQLCKFGGDSVCAGFFTGDMDYNGIKEALNQLSEADAEDWIRLVTDGIGKELGNTRFLKVTENIFTDSFDRIIFAIPQADREFVKMRFEDLYEKRTVGRADAARVTDLLYKSILKNAMPFGAWYLRYVADLTVKGERPTTKNLSGNPPPIDLSTTHISVVSDGEAVAFMRQFGKSDTKDKPVPDPGKSGDRAISTETTTLPPKK